MEEGQWFEEGELIIGGDFNIRIGEEGKYFGQNIEDDFKPRVSKDKKINNGGKRW